MYGCTCGYAGPMFWPKMGAFSFESLEYGYRSLATMNGYGYDGANIIQGYHPAMPITEIYVMPQDLRGYIGIRPLYRYK